MKSVRYDREEVMAVEAPEFTKTWHPIAHRDLILSLDNARNECGIGLEKETYSMTKGGLNLFGIWVLDIEKSGIHIQVGFRNSISKVCAVGIVAGTFVTVCSNMQFKGDYIELRRHTGNLLETDLKQICNNAFFEVLSQGHKAIDWHLSLHDAPLFGDNFKCATYDAMNQKILSPRSFDKFKSAYKEELEMEMGNQSVYAFHGAITRVSRELNLFSIGDRTRKLGELCDKYRIAA